MELSTSEKAALRKDVSGLPKGVRTSFQKAFDAWKKTWFLGGLAINSNPYARAHGKEFGEVYT
jgi:hypothetical protein